MTVPSIDFTEEELDELLGLVHAAIDDDVRDYFWRATDRANKAIDSVVRKLQDGRDG